MPASAWLALAGGGRGRDGDEWTCALAPIDCARASCRYARREFDGLHGIVRDFCVGRGRRYRVAFLDGGNGAIVRDDYKGCEPVFKLGTRIEAGCLVRARRKFEELIGSGHASSVAEEAIRRMAGIFWSEKHASHQAEARADSVVKNSPQIRRGVSKKKLPKQNNATMDGQYRRPLEVIRGGAYKCCLAAPILSIVENSLHIRRGVLAEWLRRRKSSGKTTDCPEYFPKDEIRGGAYKSLPGGLA